MAKPVSRATLDLRAANKIMNILADEPASTQQRILDFVSSSIRDKAINDEKEKHAAAMAAYRQPALPYTTDIASGGMLNAAREL
jgi:hypothetical protein